MNSLHADLLKEIKRFSRPVDTAFLDKYFGNTDHKYGLKVPELRGIAKAFYKTHKDLTTEKLTELLDSLYSSHSCEEKNLASELIGLYNDYRLQISLTKMYEWIEKLIGWVEVDNLCQSNFPAKEVLPRWHEWEKFLTKLNLSSHISHRRASLVLFEKVVSQTEDPRVHKLALRNISNLWHEKDVLITKAISWTLRSASETCPQDIDRFIETNRANLPAIAYRETRKKLDTGKKTS